MAKTTEQTKKTRLQRQCAACRQMNEKRSMIRIVRTPDGTVLCDPGGRMNGRGAYLCRSEQCLKRAMKTKCLDRSLKAKLPDAVYQQLEQEITG